MLKIFIILFCLFSQIFSYGSFPTRDNHKHVGVEISKAFYNSFPFADFGIFTLNYFLYGKIEVIPGFFILADFPLTHYSVQNENQFGDTSEESETNVGNPYVGFSYTQNGVVIVNLGTRLPFSGKDNKANILGFISNYERLEAFVPEMWPIILDVNYLLSNQNFGSDVSLGPRIMFFYGDDINDKVDLLINYKFGGFVKLNQVLMKLGWIGTGILSEDDIDFEHRFVDHLYLEFNYNSPQFTPGLYIKTPIDDNVSDIYDVSIGVYGHLNL